MAEPRVLLLDIETMPSTVFTWGAKVPSGWINASMLVDEAYMCCAAWKWLGEDEVHVARMHRTAAMPDLPIIRAIVRAWNRADAIVAQNGDRFDLKWVKARMLKAGLPPPKPVIQIDTLKMLKQNFSEFALFSASLGHVSEFLGLGKKIKTDFDLWKDVRAGKPGALDQMVEYNIQDVKLLEKIYEKIKPYAANKLNRALFSAEDRICPTCGTQSLEARGLAHTKARSHQRFHCTTPDCGAWSQRPIKKPTPRVVR